MRVWSAYLVEAVLKWHRQVPWCSAVCPVVADRFVVGDAHWIQLERSDSAMLLTGQILTGSTHSIATKQGESLQKTKLKLIDIGPEASGGDVYWVDFLGEAALAEDELRQITRQAVTVEIRRFSATAGQQGGRAYLNANAGAVPPPATIL